LEHTLEHAFVICKGGIIALEHLPVELQELEKNKGTFYGQAREYKSDDILKALNRSNWNKSKAAKLLGISRPTLYTKMKEFKLVEPVE
jgi:transcriptional regulator of acetoin/glycerol metabolism